jgi:acetyl-CoA acetyltransferase
MSDAFVLGGVRTPVGRYGGSLSHIRTMTCRDGR